MAASFSRQHAEHSLPALDVILIECFQKKFQIYERQIHDASYNSFSLNMQWARLQSCGIVSGVPLLQLAVLLRRLLNHY